MLSPTSVFLYVHLSTLHIDDFVLRTKKTKSFLMSVVYQISEDTYPELLC